MTKTKLELTWIGKDKRPRLEPRILLEDPSKSYHATSKVSDNDIFDNKLIFGDNLLALKALEREYAGKIKCIFIDPPYNTGSAFTHYDDGLEHSIWLGLMRDRIEIIRNLLSEDGSLWITLDDNEVHYFKVMCDEVFGRESFLADITWQKTTSVHNNADFFSSATDHVLCYTKSRSDFKMNLLPRSERNKADYSNPDNDARGPWTSSPLHVSLTSGQRGKSYAATGKSTGLYPIINPHGEEIFPPKGRCWAYSLDSIESFEEQGLIWWGKDGRNQPRLKRFINQSKNGVVPVTLWTSDEVGHNQEAKSENAKLLPDTKELFSTPKPERLIERIITLSTNSGDLVLDSFAGSGTTGAVAHKMGRRWIMVELGEHCHSHIIPRLQKVIDGEDKGGVTESTGWQGGGGFRYYKLAPSLMKKDQWDNWIINPEYNQEMLVEAMCKLEGYTYTPSETEYWNHGKGSETDFIYVTTQTLSDQQLHAISEEVGEGRTLLIIASAWRSKNIDRFTNLTLKKIPNSIIKACEWGHDDYSLNVQNLPMSEPDIEEKTIVKKVKNTKEQSQVMGDLFGDQT
ncbi:DNA methylase family protein [Acinetobacter baumannii OIFC0162]|uniref:site-specific DNA-methyltransferase n=1 Tax=Acinetobacter baumannii TaxID=470 RepID=UPI00028C8401|nr:site-specific DNA-methyltransferase [Acinetobacter baumannii]EKK08879.1 DNA methylase family protein [Acinetobacter baumannii OIFC0162]KCY18853.1 DNA methylase family protein [Acinetobacter baumannii 233846]OTM39036.1 site-specific DNA-methyltransferase [Acinetobacter baumannii]